MAYTAKDYNNLIGMEGFSETLIQKPFYPLSRVCDQHQQSFGYPF